MTFAEQRQADLSIFFNSSELGRSATLNSSAVTVLVSKNEQVESTDALVDALEVVFKTSDYATITYRTDALIFDGETWRYPTLVNKDSLTKTVRFTKNPRPRASAR